MSVAEWSSCNTHISLQYPQSQEPATTIPPSTVATISDAASHESLPPTAILISSAVATDDFLLFNAKNTRNNINRILEAIRILFLLSAVFVVGFLGMDFFINAKIVSVISGVVV